MKVASRKRNTRGALLAGFSLTLLCGGSQTTQSASLPPWVRATAVGGLIQLEWATQPGTFYEIQSRTNLSSGSWVTVDSVAAQSLQATWTESFAPSGGRYYRIFMPRGEVSLVEPPERPPAQPCNCGGASAQPATQPNLHLFSGEFHLDAEDLRIPGRGFDFVWARKYRSRLGPDTPQGNGWDFSYNVSARRLGPYIEVRDGNTRRDLYTLQPDGSYGADGLFTEGRVTNETLTVRFSDNGRWEFHPFTSPGVGGKLKQSVDRNSNTMRFEYDGLARLVRVVDTLGRTNVISYNADGFISAVTDFSGRQVKYFYYQNADAGGVLGDLRHVVSPVVTSTPNGNDFPDGKTNTYTYSKGQPQPALNHNLLTTVNGRGQTTVSNRYNTVTTVTNRNFDTIEIEILSLGLHSIEPVTVPLVPGLTNNGASKKTILNDRVGNVQEYFFDASNRLVLKREFTGRANPSQPTTETLNRPVGPLHPGDPPFFDTSFVWNVDSLPVQIVHPNGTSVSNVYEGDLDPAAPHRTRGALREVHRLPGPLGGDQAELVDLYEYDTTFGGCCGFNYVTKHTDPRTNITLHAYDERGNRTNTLHAVPGVVESWEYNAYGQMTAHILPDNGSGHRRRDEFVYYASGPQAGYVQLQVTDAGPVKFNLTNSFEYDLVGNRVRLVDPAGNDSRLTVNSLNQVVRLQLPVVNTSNGPVRFEKLVWFDADDNRTREDVQNIDDLGVLKPNAWFTASYDYDELNQLTRAVREADTTRSITNEFAYDANQNRMLVRFGEAANGNDPFNTITTLYDERDLPFREIRGIGSPAQSTTQFDYDGNRNLVQKLHGLEAGPHATVYAYDGYDRRITSTDAMGNLSSWRFDASDNVVTNRVDGELLDVPGSAGNTRLAEKLYAYDAMNRLIRADAAFFDTQTQLPIGDGFSTTLIEFSPNSLVLATVNDNNHTNRYLYDTANRLAVAMDPKGNSVTNAFDANGNVVVRTEVDKSDLGNPDQVVTRSYTYDTLNRMVRTVNDLNHTNRFAYDSRHNRVASTDGRGNVTRYEYDGLGRLVRTEHLMTDTGDGSGIVVDFITTLQSWDDSSRLTAQTDPNWNTTAYAYDSLNRRVRTLQADGTGWINTFDVHDNQVGLADANGSFITSYFDDNDRLVTNVVQRGTGVLGSTNEIYAYDGLNRLVQARNDDSEISRDYDSLSRIVRETQRLLPIGPPRRVVSAYDGVGNRTQLTYPGGRVVNMTYDELECMNSLSDTLGLIAIYSGVGSANSGWAEPPGSFEPLRFAVVKRRIPGGDMDDGSFSVKPWGATLPLISPGKPAFVLIPGPPRSPVDESPPVAPPGSGRDDTGSLQGGGGAWRRSERRDFGNGTRTEFDFDPVRRMSGVRASRIATSAMFDHQIYAHDAANNKVFAGQPLALPTPDNHAYRYDSLNRLVQNDTVIPFPPPPVQYVFDRAGNRISVSGSIDPGPYTQLATLPEPADFQMNQYTTTPFDNRTYDRNGNLTANGIGSFVYDFRNRLVSATGSGFSSDYRYDCLGRRISRTLNGTTANFYFDGWREIEEQSPVHLTAATWVWGDRPTELISQQRGGTTHYFHADDLGSVIAATDHLGSVAERYAYEDYGSPKFKDAFGNPIASSAIGNAHLFNSRFYEEETRLAWHYTRYLDLRAGAYVSRETDGLWADLRNPGQGHVFNANNPMSKFEPLGGDYTCLVTKYRQDNCRTINCEWGCLYVLGKLTTLFKKYEYDRCICKNPYLDDIEGPMTGRDVWRYYEASKKADEPMDKAMEGVLKGIAAACRSLEMR